MSVIHKMAKAGEKLSAKAMTKLRRSFPFMRDFLRDEDRNCIQPKSDAKDGQWACADCGEMLQNNMQAHRHPRGHRLAWWTGHSFEEA